MQPTVAQLEMKGRRTEHQQGQPLAAIFGHVAEHCAHGGGIVQIMLGLQQVVEAGSFGGFNQAHGDLFEEFAFAGQLFGDLIEQMD